MNVYMSINLIELKEGRPYFFSVPQGSQDWSEVYTVLDEMKKQIEDLELKQKQSAAPTTEAVEVTESKE